MEVSGALHVRVPSHSPHRRRGILEPAGRKQLRPQERQPMPALDLVRVLLFVPESLSKVETSEEAEGGKGRRGTSMCGRGWEQSPCSGCCGTVHVRNDGVGPGDGHQPPPRAASNSCARSCLALAFASHCSAEGAGGAAATLAGAGGVGTTAEAGVPASLSQLQRVLGTATTLSSSRYLERAWAASAARSANAGAPRPHRHPSRPGMRLRRWSGGGPLQD